MKAIPLNASQRKLVDAFVRDHRRSDSDVPVWARLLCRQFCAAVGGVAAWTALSVEEKLALPRPGNVNTDWPHRAHLIWPHPVPWRIESKVGRCKGRRGTMATARG